MPNQLNGHAFRLNRYFPTILLVLSLLLLYCWLSFSASQKHSHVFDEVIHVTGGYSYWRTADYRINPDNGIFPQRWMALPLLFQNINFPSLQQPSWWQSDLWNVSHQFFYQSGNDVRRMIFSARIMICLLGMLLGGVIFLWSNRLFGLKGAFLSLLLFVFCPAFLAHGSLATNDLSVSLFLTASVMCIWTVLHRISLLSLFVASVAVAGALLSKASGLLILPIAGILTLIRLLTRSPMLIKIGKNYRETREFVPILLTLAISACLISVIVVAIIWSFYGFRFEIFRSSVTGRDRLTDGASWETVVQLTGNFGKTVEVLRKHEILPEPYLYGLLAQRKSIRLRRSFLNGEYSISGFRSFFLYCLIYKTPLAFFGILLLAFYALMKQMRNREVQRWLKGEQSIVPLMVLLVVYWVFATTASLNIGHRHILPTYAPMFILSGSAAAWMHRRHRVFMPTVLLLVFLFLLESILVRPYYLSYFNTLAGGSKRAFHHLVDSSLDWGQDLPALKEWLQQNSVKEDRVYLSYFGTAVPEYYGIRSVRLAGFPDVEATKQWVKMEGGIYCISATMLQSLYNKAIGPWNVVYEKQYREILQKTAKANQLHLLNHFQLARLCAYLRKREPDDSAGYSILIYKLTDREIAEALYGPPAELYPRVMVAGLSR